MKNKLVLVVALLVGILAFWLSARYLANEKAELYKGAVKVKVIVAKQKLSAMTELTRSDLALKEVYKSAVGENVFRPEDVDRVLGKRLKYPLERGEPLWWTHVDMPRDIESGLAPVIQKGQRALSIAISGAAAVSGLIKPNDHVDILGTFTFPSRTNPNQTESTTLTLLQDVTVLATGTNLARQNTEGGGETKAGYSMVTFEVSTEEAELLVFAQQTRGQLYLSLRNPNDVSAQASFPSVNFDYLESVLQEINEKRQINNRSSSL
ncbi:Flp pilus assembly protein CpaB [Pontiella sp.]|uniref:Flp pilus assembly protein CpaB n=1 Tax=Pontiella sp. TaxID=2837462 RepID=UPI003568F85C